MVHTHTQRQEGGRRACWKTAPETEGWAVGERVMDDDYGQNILETCMQLSKDK